MMKLETSMRAVAALVFAVALLFPLTVFGQAIPAASIQIAILQGDLEAVEQHIATGTYLDAKDAYGSSPLTLAATFGKTAIARALIDAGADMAVSDPQGSSPLHIAAFFGHADIIKALLAKGADRYARNLDGSTAFDIATTSFADDVPIYDQIGKALAPLGLVLDYQAIATSRQPIADLLRSDPDAFSAVEFKPAERDDWEVATPAQAGLNHDLISELYFDAGHLQNLWGLLVIKDGKLIAEDYFHQGAVDQLSTRHSITKSVLSALYGVARKQGCLPDLDRKMVEFFPELADQITDPRKAGISIREMLQMRSGYPMEILSVEHNDLLFYSDNWEWIPHLVDFPLTLDPGTKFQYSNLTSQLLAVILARACDTDLQPFAEKFLLTPIGAKLGKWSAGPDGYRMGWGEISMTARDMAKFGLLFLNGGKYQGTQVLPADWVGESLQAYFKEVWMTPKIGRYLRDIGYGYQWWSATAGEHRFDYAMGHGGQMIVLLHDLNMIIVTTADPQLELDPIRDLGWERELAIINVVGKFIASLAKN